ncbi:hypothetical protein BC835DRAFT_1288082 [Cytidiella melzeri]|nr:hypothetical protein BC835DRAFT_1288082 [Cytidiella melzeri]
MAPRRRCGVCGSKQWRKEPSSGFITCSEGHVLQNYRNETREVNELGPHTVRKRTLKSGRKKKERVSKADPKLYHGNRGRYHYFQCLQLVLRLQIKAVSEAWHLPSEFEIVCRDIWTLHLCLLPSPPPPEPYHHLVDQYGGKKDIRNSRQQEQSFDSIDEKEEVPETKDSDGQHDSGPDSSSSESDEGELDDEMEKLLRENSEASSSDDGDEQLHTQPSAGSERGRSKKGQDTNKGYDSPAANLAVLMVACWTMRVPVIYKDFIKLIESYDLPYLDPVRLLPESLALHLTKQTRQALSPHFAPTTMHIHKLTSRLAKHMYNTHGIFTPECNAAPILWRVVKRLRGTPTLYMLTKKLAHILSLPLTLHRALSPILRRIKPLDPEYHKYDNAPVEVSLAAAVVVVLKLVYGLDGKNRTPTDREDPACAMPNFSEWMEAVKSMEAREGDVRDRLFDVGEDMPSALDLDDGMVDSYLDFCETALLAPKSSENQNIVLRDFFPLQPHLKPHACSQETVNDVLQITPPQPLPATPLRTAFTNLRPGQSYRIYHTSDILGSLPEDYEFFVARVAKWAGVDERCICGVVERFERRLARWWNKIRKEERKREGGGRNTGENKLDEEV